jgi:hypothetical protein
MNNEIYRTLKENIKKPEVCFIFHSETAALFWGRFALRKFNMNAVPRSRFIAWDIFKSKNLSAFYSDKTPVTRSIRILYARKLCEENAAAPFLKHIIPLIYAKDGILFAKSIASILPCLNLWQRKMAETENRTELFTGAEFADFAQLEIRYKDFLNKHNLFEPSWERPPFKDREREYFIFYPELIEDFVEYEELLNTSNVYKIPIGLKDEADETGLLVYQTAYAELRAAALELRRLRFEKGIPWNDIALNVCELPVIEPYLKRILRDFNIPFCVRSGKEIAEYGAGIFFEQINECARSYFSWNSIEALLTNTKLPWRTPNKNRALLQFGIKNNCVASYRDNGYRRDIWNEAFYASKGKERLHNHYKKLNIKIKRITASKDFETLHKRIINFFAHFFLRIWPPDVSALLGRALEELSLLSALEKKYPVLSEAAPLEVFILILKEKVHVNDSGDTESVNIFEYGVAASAPCAAHIIINASQKALTRLYKPLPFLNNSVRRALNIADTDASKAFIKSYTQSFEEGAKNFVRISAARQAFSGAQIPHSYFLRPKTNAIHDAIPDAQGLQDFYQEEKNWWLRGGAFCEKLFLAQKKSFLSWNFFFRDSSFNFISSAIPQKSAAAFLLKERMEKRRIKGRLPVSATTLNTFFFCPLKWLYGVIFKLKNYDTTAQLLNAENRGILYHIILQKLFERIKDEDVVLRSANFERYALWAEEITKNETAHFRRFKGRLASKLTIAMSPSICANILRLLRMQVKKFNGWSVDTLEKSYTKEYESFVLNGKIDCVLISPDGMPIVIDYKTGRTPKKEDCWLNENNDLEDFQIPVYIKLFEILNKMQVEYASFFKATKAESADIVSPSGRSKTRADYQTSIDALSGFILRYLDAADSLDFSVRPLLNERCAKCDYKNVCRTNLY